MMRQIHKQTLTIGTLIGMIWLVFALVAPTAAMADVGTGPIVADPLTGVAMDGVDPVSYFTEMEPEKGRADFEYDWGGAPWYFASAANRDIFMRSPQIYAPQFGGHDATSLSRGYLSGGNPHIYLLLADRLYLFYSAGNRDAFILSPGAALQNAATNWPKFVGKDANGPVSAALDCSNSSCR